jgi:hypothetical protein
MEHATRLYGAAITVCILLTWGAIASAQPSTPETPPSNGEASPPANAEPSTSMEQPLPGDHWSYEVRDAITGVLKYTTTFTITDVTPAEIAVRGEALGNPGTGFFVYDHFWNLKKSPLWQYSPNDGSGIKLPLNPGSTWKFQNDQLNVQHGASFRRSGTSKVVAQESVTTNAGTFDTFKIETSINTRNVNDPTRSGSSTVTTWYAPSIDHWVKQVEDAKSNGHVVQSTSVELVDYGRR